MAAEEILGKSVRLCYPLNYTLKGSEDRIGLGRKVVIIIIEDMLGIIYLIKH